MSLALYLKCKNTLNMDDNALATFEAHWLRHRIPCVKWKVPPPLVNTPVGRCLEKVGMPAQEWWPFVFHSPTTTNEWIEFGEAGTACPISWSLESGECVVTDRTGRFYANNSFESFCQCLVEFDNLRREVLKNCPGDTDAEWARADKVITAMIQRVSLLDDHAFKSEKYLWPQVLQSLDG